METPTWEQGAEEAAKFMLEGHYPLNEQAETEKDLIFGLDMHIQRLIETNFQKEVEEAFVPLLLITASYALALIEMRTMAPADEVVTDIRHLIARKQNDYGHGNILKFGKKGLIVRLSDKGERIKNLVKKRGEGHAVAESIDDTLADIVGYVLIGIMLSDGTFERPLAADL